MSEVGLCLDVQRQAVESLSQTIAVLIEKLSPVIVSGELPPLAEEPPKPERNCLVSRSIELHTDRVNLMQEIVNSAIANLCI